MIELFFILLLVFGLCCAFNRYHETNKEKKRLLEYKQTKSKFDNLSAQHKALLDDYNAKKSAIDNARDEVDALELLKSNAKAIEKSEEKIAELETDIAYLNGLFEKSKNPSKMRELRERIETAEQKLNEIQPIYEKQKAGKKELIKHLAFIREKIKRANKAVLCEDAKVQDILKELEAAQDELSEAETAAGNMRAKYNHISSIKMELNLLWCELVKLQRK